MKKGGCRQTKTEKLGLTHHNLHWWVAGRMVWRRLQLGRPELCVSLGVCGFRFDR